MAICKITEIRRDKTSVTIKVNKEKFQIVSNNWNSVDLFQQSSQNKWVKIYPSFRTDIATVRTIDDEPNVNRRKDLKQKELGKLVTQAIDVAKEFVCY